MDETDYDTPGAGCIVFYNSGGESTSDYGIVTFTSNIDNNWAYWVREEQKLSFDLNLRYNTIVGPSVIGKWND